MLCYYDDTIVPDVNNSITYNSSNNLLLNGNLGISYAEMKKNYMSWNWVEYQCYLVPIVYVGNFKTMMDYFIQSELNVVILYVSSRPNSFCVPTSGRIGISHHNLPIFQGRLVKEKIIYHRMICYKSVMILYLTIHLLITIDLTIMSLMTIKIMRH